MKQWGWKTSGTALGLTIVLAVALVRPVGVSTQFVIFDGILWDLVYPETVYLDAEQASGFGSLNRYLNDDGGKYAKAVAAPFGYGMVFVVSMMVGGFLSRKLSTNANMREQTIETSQHQHFSSSASKRYLAALVGGVLALYGARLAGGCTSGHMMSGMMQTSYSSYVFTLAVFLVAIPVALILHRNDRSKKTRNNQ